MKLKCDDNDMESCYFQAVKGLRADYANLKQAVGNNSIAIKNTDQVLPIISLKKRWIHIVALLFQAVQGLKGDYDNLKQTVDNISIALENTDKVASTYLYWKHITRHLLKLL